MGSSKLTHFGCLVTLTTTYFFVHNSCVELGPSQGFEVHPLVRSIRNSTTVSEARSAQQHEPGSSVKCRVAEEDFSTC